jgi:arylsulfatase A-like enzyme
MPNLSALARSAVVFESAYAVYPESIKGLFSVLCSVYPASKSAPCDALPQALRDRGYRTALFHSGRFGYLGMEDVIRDRGFDTLADAGDIGGNHQSSFGVDEPATVAQILRWIDSRPFFVAYLPIAGHHPYETPEPGPFPDNNPFDRYRNALHYDDAALGALIEGVRARGLEHRTLWIVLGDHGEAFGQHHENYGHTFHLYEENIRVPFLVAAPGLIEPARARRVVSLIDTAPTVLDLIGAPSSARHQGRTMLDPDPRPALFFADYSLGLFGLRDGPRKFIYEYDTGRARLFDLDADPGETTDRAPLEPDAAQRYLRNLRAAK